MSLLELRDVSGGYGQSKVLHDIDLVVEPGHVAVVLGANGAGKTTTLRAISGVIPTQGEIVFDGKSIVGKSPEAVSRLGIAEPILLGPGRVDPETDSRVIALATLLRNRRPHAVRDGLHAIDLASDPVRFGAGLVAMGEADGCVAGAVTATADVVRAALWAVGTSSEGGSVSAAVYHGLNDGRVLTFTDVAVIPEPDPRQMAEAAAAACRDRELLIGDRPVVAFLSYATHGSAAGNSVDRMSEAVGIFRSLRGDVVVDGPLQLDAAIVPEVSARKCPDSPVAGGANILVFPSLDAANIGYKLTERLAGASAAGPLLQGLARPMSDLSRGARVDDIVDVVAMVALQGSGINSSINQER